MRTMLTLSPAYAMSRHHSQGVTLEKVIVKLGPATFTNGLAHTASGTGNILECLVFDSFPNSTRFFSMAKKYVFKFRREQNEREAENDAALEQD